jgi:phospholipid N-methyltransferase
MARLTRQQEREHDDALALLSLTRALTLDEKEFVFRHYHPMATHRVSKGGIFFTPYEIANDLAVMARLNCGGRVIDLAAGIGVLTHHMLLQEQWDTRADAKHHVCVELDPEFVEVGQKLLPQVEWICGDIFDAHRMSALGAFQTAISNPPFGSVPTTAGRKGLQAHVPAHLATVELMVRMCELGGHLIMPRADQEYQPATRTHSRALQRLLTAFPGLRVSMCQDLDWDGYSKWQGAHPDAVIADVSVNDLADPAPFGFPEITSANARPLQLAFA